MDSNQQSFWQFCDQIRLQTSSFANLSINDSIWSTSFGTKRPEDRLNFDVQAGGDINSSSRSKQKDLNSNNLNDSKWSTALATKTREDRRNYDVIVNGDGSSSVGGLKEGLNFDGWKAGFTDGPVKASSLSNDGVMVGNSLMNSSFNRGLGKGIYSKSLALSRGNNLNVKFGKNGVAMNDDETHGGKAAKRNGSSNRNNNNSSNSNSNDKNSVDKRFKSLPAAESLPRNETIGGYIFVCNNDTMEENLRRQLFGLPPRYRDSVRAITPGLPLFLYNYSTHQLHGIFEAASFGGSNIHPCAWEDKKSPGESRFPAQVKAATRKICQPLEEDSFRPLLHHYDGPKFRLELNIPEVISLLDIFEENSA